MTKSQMQDLEKVYSTPQADKDNLHSGRLYPSELDEAILDEEPLIYSRSKLTEILQKSILVDKSVIEAYIEKEISPLFNLM
jgi:hypothetical protein